MQTFAKQKIESRGQFGDALRLHEACDDPHQTLRPDGQVFTERRLTPQAARGGRRRRLRLDPFGK